MINLSDIAPAFSFVASKGLVPSAGIYKSQEFGNATLVMKGVPISLRFYRDRSQVFVDVGGDVDEWYKLEYVLEFVDSTITQQQLGEPPSSVIMADLLQDRWDKVEDLFRSQQRVLQLQTFAKKKSSDFLDEIFGKK